MVKWRYEGGPEGQKNENLALRNLWTTPKDLGSMMTQYNFDPLHLYPECLRKVAMGFNEA